LCRGWLRQYQASNQTRGQKKQSHEQHGPALACETAHQFSPL